jgi:menaquinone reductase, molybdopterin-binding-like subunit
MKLDRRNFIKLVVGGAVGMHVTPIPWKLTDDIAIWTQNWPWVPVPPRGEFKTVDSVCTLCSGGCGIRVRKVDDRAVKIEGRTDYPVNPGGICPLGSGGLQLLYNESIRFTGPMKRVGPRGAGVFMNISWDEALDTLAGRISTLRKEGRPEALAAVDGNRMQSTVSVLVERLMYAVGTPNYERIPTIEDTYRTANFLMQGTYGPMAYDLENADYVLSFDAGLLEGWGAPGRVINAWALWHSHPVKRSAKIVQVESRASNTASKADQWVAARPGTEGALALGLAHVLIKQGLYDTEFVNNHTFGFNDWQSPDGTRHMGFKAMVLKNYSPSRVAQITAVEEKTIVGLAEDFARAKAPLAISGKGSGYLNGRLFDSMAVQSLNALAGNINKAGGALVHNPLPLGSLPEMNLDAIAQEGLRKGRLDQALTASNPFTPSLINNFAETILASPSSPINTLLVFSANPAFTLPDAGAFQEALEKIPYIVSFSPYRDETALMADLILPDHTYLEKRDDVIWPTGLQYPLYGLTKPVVDPVYDTRSTGETLLQLAKKIGGPVASAFPWKSYEEVLKVRARGLFDADAGLTRYDPTTPAWKQLAEGKDLTPDYKNFEEMWKSMESGGLWYRPAHPFKNWDTIFTTPTGKYEFRSTRLETAVHEFAGGGSEPEALKKMGIQLTGDEAYMPHYEPGISEVDRTEYPLVMVPYQIINLSAGWTPSPPFVFKTLFIDQLNKTKSYAVLHPRTAAEYQLKEGQWVHVESAAGKVRVGVTLFEGAMPGFVYLLSGLGHTAYDEFIRGKGVNPNRVVSATRDPLTGYPIWWETPVKLTKA